MSIGEYRDKHAGERVFLIGNGPSLTESPLDALDQEVTIAMNNIDRIYSETEWRPSYYLNVQGATPRPDPPRHWIDKHVRIPMRTVNLGITSFLSSGKQSLFPDRRNIVYLEKINLDVDKNDMLYKALHGGNIDDIWKRDLEDGVYRRHTSMYAAAQLAAYMGFSDLYFVGCDLYPEFKPFSPLLFESGSDPHEYQLRAIPSHKMGIVDFLVRDGRPIRSAVNGFLYKCLVHESLMMGIYWLLSRLGLLGQRHFTGPSRQSHFTDDYQTHVRNEMDFTSYGTNESFEAIHRVIKGIGSRVGFETYNATVGGQLEVHQRVDIQDMLG